MTDQAGAKPSHPWARLKQELERSRQDVETCQTRVIKAETRADELELRVREVDHRAKNSLQLAAAMLHIQAQASPSDAVTASLNEAVARLSTLADIHAALYNAADHETMAMRPWIGRICDGSGLNPAVEIAVDAPEFAWPVALATPVGLFVGEAVANALKHAFGPAGGRIVVSLSRFDHDAWCLRVADDGIGHPGAPTSGLGMKLLAVFARQLHGTLGVEPGLEGRGMAAVVRFQGPPAEPMPLI